ncbi:PAS domain-containing protein, partial [Halobacterium sp. PCN9]|nr:PAS domain-containing protein [Halobacterium bonnevillei]
MVEAESGLVTAVAEALLDGADVLVVARDHAGRVTFANRYAREVLRYEHTDLVGRHWFEECLPDAVRGERVERSDRLLAGDAEPPLRHEHAVVARDGERRVVDWQTVRYRDADGDVAGTLSTGRDVTERRRREADLEASEHRYEALVDQFPNGLVTLFDEDHRYQVVGGTGFEHLGVSPADLEGERLADVFPPENVETLEPLYDRAFDGESSTVEVGLEDRVFCVHVVPVRDDDGTVVAGMTMSQDVTERAERERELEAARGRYRTLLQAAPDPVFVADADTGDVVEVNEAAEAFRGEPREDIVGPPPDGAASGRGARHLPGTLRAPRHGGRVATPSPGRQPDTRGDGRRHAGSRRDQRGDRGTRRPDRRLRRVPGRQRPARVRTRVDRTQRGDRRPVHRRDACSGRRTRRRDGASRHRAGGREGLPGGRDRGRAPAGRARGGARPRCKRRRAGDRAAGRPRGVARVR